MVIPWETFKGKTTMKQYYVYMTINLIDNKKYIGQHYGELNDNSGSTLKKPLKIFLGLPPNGSTDTLHKYIKSYHGYIVKFL